MRITSLLFLLLPIAASACTMAKVTRNGYTLVGNNEDAFSINACLKFERGGPGEFGAVYVCHFNGSPLRSMGPQGGMNEAGLVFDGLVVEQKVVAPRPGGNYMDFAELMPLVMRRCANVHEAEALIGTFDVSPMTGGMIVLVDRTGEYLIVQNDTMFTGNDATYAVGNFRPAACKDFDAVPIPRFQKGRALLAHQADTSLAFCTALMDSMCARRVKLGNGTLYTDILDPQRGLLHLFFYHDLSEQRTFNLKDELAKGDHIVEMAPFFGTRPEYEALLSYRTPFHQRWIWWFIALIGVLSLLGAIWSVGLCLFHVIACIRSRSLVAFAPWGVIGLGCGIAVFLCGLLLLSEGVYYFGLGDATDRIHPLLRWSPLLLLACSVYLVVRSLRVTRHRAWIRSIAVLHGTLVAVMVYWGMLWPL